MTQQEVDKVVAMAESGYLIKIYSPYIDSFATLTKKITGEWYIHSDLWMYEPLNVFPFTMLSFHLPPVETIDDDVPD